MTRYYKIQFKNQNELVNKDAVSFDGFSFYKQVTNKFEIYIFARKEWMASKKFRNIYELRKCKETIGCDSISKEKFEEELFAELL